MTNVSSQTNANPSWKSLRPSGAGAHFGCATAGTVANASIGRTGRLRAGRGKLLAEVNAGGISWKILLMWLVHKAGIHSQGLQRLPLLPSGRERLWHSFI